MDDSATEVESEPGEPEINAVVRDWKFDAYYELPEAPEPSGLCYFPPRDTLLVVDDGGEDRQPGLYELSLEGELLGPGQQFGKDIEGVTYCPTNGRVYVADEADERVFVLDGELNMLGDFTVSRMFDGNEFLTAGGNGFEGLTWVPDSAIGISSPRGWLLLANQDDPHALLAVAVADAEPGASDLVASHAWTLPERNVGALHYDGANNELWVVNSWLNTLAVIDAASLADSEPEVLIKRWEVVPGLAQEGVTLDPQGRLWVAQDLGGAVRYKIGD